MRIVIDFLDGRDAVTPASLARARELAADLARDARGATLWVAAPGAAPDVVETLRLAFAGLLGRERVRAFALHADQRLDAALRRQALAGLLPDVVLVAPGAPGAPDAVSEFATVALDAGATVAELRLRLEATAAERRPAASLARPRLAYVSPLPPEKSGIADYSAELAPELARYYEVELIVEQEHVDDVRLAGLPQRSAAWLREHAGSYDRVFYHFGNSPVHKHMFALVRDVPGVVLMHDFYFGNVVDWLEHQAVLPQGFLKGMYESHGLSGLHALRRDGRNPTVWKHPVNRGVLDHASGVIVHSAYPKQLAEQWYGPGAADGWRTIPLLRGKPPGHGGPDARARARKRLGIKADDFVVCTFGMLGPTKLNAELLDAWLASTLAADKRCRLVFVGANDPGAYGVELDKKLHASGAAKRIAITGFVDAAAYADWLEACDCAVQLRGASRGETSAAVLDCLLYGVATIVNAHGSTASLAQDLLVMLPDHVETAALAAALERLHGDAALRASLGQRAAAYMEAEHAPAHAGRLCYQAIEHFARHGEHAAYRAAVSAAAPLCAEEELPALAAAIAFNRVPTAPRQLLVDVSALVQKDLRTGIQRVVRSVLLAMIADPPPGYRIEPVFTVGNGQPYHYARRYGLELVGATGLALEDAPVDLRPGDIFFGLDLFLSGTAQNVELLADMRTRGVEVYFCMYDILPMLRPDVFPFGTEVHFGAFLRAVHRVADGIVCISRAVADELAGWIGAENLQRRSPLQLGWFHLGADIDASAPSSGLPPDAERVFAALARRPSFLMVGTVEPRKGHAQALAAFDLLWERGVDANLVIVGKEGWMVEQVAARLKDHPELGQRLFWLAGVSDEMLLKLYAGSSALLAPSEGEGFGLPLIEAAQHDIPIIARDIPVFREVAGAHAHYFSGLAAGDLADAVAGWIALWRDGRAPTSTGMPWLTWDRSARQVLDAIVGHQWYRVLPGTEG
ncbi:glycosyltransferase [uncultured Massilia sp.]|uniref:glycosyltransferase n=1 Tax=uncultured Massilia sp. TaxID=169973 RepID=UPI0025DCC23A|nr:glycosyltransferase [uncultured Massilia sp.]